VVVSESDDAVVPFDELPVLPGSGLRHAWDVWGSGDNLGTLNRLTGPVVTAAAAAVRTGERIGLTLPLGLPDPPFFGRQRYRHSFVPMGQTALDDYVDGFYLQCSSQWDGLRHVRSGPDGWYGGWHGQPDADLDPLGIHHWAQRGIIGRGVLVDLAGARDGAGYDPFSRVAFTPGDITAALDAQGSELRYGDILCVRTGWVDKYLTLGEDARRELAATMVTVSGFSSAGLAGSEEMSRFLWDSGVAALPCDNPSVEVVPADPAQGSLHRRLIPHLGFAIGELFDFAPLARACRRERRYEFLFTSVPLNVTGAVGSPANAVAVL
jgi:kynurenine formamidase